MFCFIACLEIDPSLLATSSHLFLAMRTRKATSTGTGTGTATGTGTGAATSAATGTGTGTASGTGTGTNAATAGSHSNGKSTSSSCDSSSGNNYNSVSSSNNSSTTSGVTSRHVCVWCAASVPAIYLESAGTVRHVICKTCSRQADPYVEVDGVALFLALMLLRWPAFRHLAFNRSARKDSLGNSGIKILVRLFALVLVVETYVIFKFCRNDILVLRDLAGGKEYLFFFICILFMGALSLIHDSILVLLSLFTALYMNLDNRSAMLKAESLRELTSTTFFMIKVASFPSFLFGLIAIFVESNKQHRTMQDMSFWIVFMMYISMIVSKSMAISVLLSKGVSISFGLVSFTASITAMLYYKILEGLREYNN